MILRVPDYYQEFSCIADKCKDSCCIGWEIDIDEESYDFYLQTTGEIGERLKKYMYQTPEGEHSFELQQHGRCPFLNATNLCDLCIELGEESLSEVCTEYPRFAIEYGNVLQKCLSLSCEEVGRILFTRDTSVEIMDLPYGPEEPVEKPEARVCDFLEKTQGRMIQILQNQDKALEERIREYLMFAEYIQKQLNEEVLDDAEGRRFETLQLPYQVTATHWEYSYEDFRKRFRIFEEMESLDEEWENTKEQIQSLLSEENYEEITKAYKASKDYQSMDYEQLMVYFTFRYLMNSVYDFDLLSYAKFAVVCTLTLRDLDTVRFYQNGNTFTREDRIDVARIFSKEVEHSEENVEFAREEFMFDEIFSVESLLGQI